MLKCGCCETTGTLEDKASTCRLEQMLTSTTPHLGRYFRVVESKSSSRTSRLGQSWTLQCDRTEERCHHCIHLARQNRLLSTSTFSIPSCFFRHKRHPSVMLQGGATSASTLTEARQRYCEGGSCTSIAVQWPGSELKCRDQKDETPAAEASMPNPVCAARHLLTVMSLGAISVSDSSSENAQCAAGQVYRGCHAVHKGTRGIDFPF